MKKLFILSTALCLILNTVIAQTKETRNVDTFTKISFRVPGKIIVRQGSPQKVEMEGNQETLAKVETKVDGSRLVIDYERKWNSWKWSDKDKITVYVTTAQIEALSVSGSGDLVTEGKLTTGNLGLDVSGSGSLTTEANAVGDIEADVSGSGQISIKGRCKNFSSDVSGSGDVNINAVMSGKVSADVSGSGKIVASGTATEIKTDISGSGRVLAANLEVDNCDVQISGSGDVEINVKNSLDATISGSGSVSYKGNPSHVNSHSAGSGKVRKM